MQHSYSPYRHRRPKRPKFSLPSIHIPKNAKVWLGIIGGILFTLFIVFYLALGELRFFANHFLGLGFFSKNYLILLQNNYELRPGGGFITGFGNLKVVMGFPQDIELKNSYEVDTANYVTPPYPHEDFLKNEWYEGYTFRDANWEPHFPDSAKAIIKFYQEKYPDQEVDGIIVINFSMIEKMIGALGGINLNDKHYNENNLFSELEFEVNNIDRHDVDALKNRKNVLGELAIHLMGKMKRHPFIAKQIIVESLNHKDLYIWLKKERLQNKLIKKGWANTLTNEENSDLLSLNLANLGSKKADRYIQSEVHYFADLSRDLPIITTEFTLRYPGSVNNYSDNYKGYLRLVVPKNAETISLPVDSQIQREEEWQVIGTKVILPAGGKTSLTYTYSLPRSLLSPDEYKLKVIKQSGSQPLYKITVETKEGQGFTGDDFDIRENRAIYVGKLKTDQQFSLAITPDTTPPYPIEQQFTGLNQIEVTWSETLGEAASNSQYELTDLNKVNPDTDNITIESVEVNDNISILNLSGITKQELEAYQILLKNITDEAGNTTLPNPKKVTAIQRIIQKAEAPEIKLGEIPLTPEAQTILTE